MKFEKIKNFKLLCSLNRMQPERTLKIKRPSTERTTGKNQFISFRNHFFYNLSPKKPQTGLLFYSKKNGRKTRHKFNYTLANSYRNGITIEKMPQNEFIPE
jgi:hypothetical protein